MKVSLMLGITIFLTTFSVYGAEPLHSTGKFLDEVSSTNVKEKIINNDEVDYHDVIILGDLDLSDLPMKAVNSNLRIVDSTFKGSINFDDVVFGGVVDFQGSAFNNNVSIMGAKFDKYVSFEGAEFGRNAKFGWSEFQGSVNFKRVKFSDSEEYSSDFFKTNFNSTVDFWKSQFGITFFNYAQFNDSSNFQKAEFLKDVNFGDASFHKDSWFKDSKFLEKALFLRTEFSGDAYFWLTSFEKDAYFYNSVFNNSVYFEDAAFLGNANFQNSIFQGYADFIGANSKGDAIFWNVSLRENNLSFNGSIASGRYAKFSRIIARWNDLEDGLKFNEFIYSWLIRNFKDLGRTGDANECYYDYRTKKPKEGLIAWAIDGLSWISCGYGVKPAFTIFWCVGLVFLFGGIFWKGKGIQRSNDETLTPASTNQTSPNDHRLWNSIRSCYLLQCIYFSLTVFVAAKSKDFSPIGGYGYLVTLERISGWFFFALFVGAMTRTIVG